jgi:heme oxygenase (biliverdin-IX-beta and delta-forming)
MAPIMTRLRVETRAQHEATEAIPFSTAILAGVLPRASYAAQLAALLPVHRALESVIGARLHPSYELVWTDDMLRAPLLEADLDDLGVTEGDARLARPEAAEMAWWIEDLAARDPVAVLGVLYVLEGSTLGGAVLRRHLASAFGLTDAGLSYYSPYGKHPKPHWMAFSQRMDAAVTDADAANRVIAAASETFVRIGRILSALSAPTAVEAS